MAVTARSTSSLNMQFEHIAEKMFSHMTRTSEELNILNLVTKSLDGEHYRVNFQTEGNAYFAARGEREWLPGYDPDTSVEDEIAGFTVGEMQFKNKDVYMSTDWTGQMKTAVKSSKGGYMNLQEFRLKDMADSIKERMAIKIAGTALGTLARIQDVSAWPSVQFRYAGYSAANVLGFENGVKYLRGGLILDAVNSARTGALRNGVGDRGRKLVSVAIDTGSTLSGPIGTFQGSAPTNWAAGDYVVQYNERQTGAISSSSDWDALKNPLGLIDAVDDGGLVAYYGGLQRAANTTLNALVFGNSGTLRQLTAQLINFAVERKKQISGGRISCAYGPFGVVRQLVDHLTIQGSGSSGNTAQNNPIRHTPGTSQQLGFNKVEIFPLGFEGKLEVFTSRLAPGHTLFLLDKESMIMMQDGPPAFINLDGKTVQRVIGRDEAVTDMKWTAAGIICREPWKNVRLDDLLGDHMTA
ncbi:MAG TPA: hypothetical protein PLC19_00170 [Marmoricola sp.]|nr:hypothetical protein [Marmoricola sp.]